MTTLTDAKIEDFIKFEFNGLHGQCRILDVYDGDTCTAGIVLNDKFVQVRLRLKGINSPEIKPKKIIENRDEIIDNAYKAKQKLIELCTNITPNDCKSKKECQEIMIKNKKIVYIKMYEFDVFGRVISELFLDSEYKHCINTMMIEGNFAIKFEKYEKYEK